MLPGQAGEVRDAWIPRPESGALAIRAMAAGARLPKKPTAPANGGIDLSGPGWSDGQRTTAKALKDAMAANQAVLSLAHNMAQENGMTAAMIDVITEFVKDKSITADEAVTRLASAVESVR